MSYSVYRKSFVTRRLIIASAFAAFCIVSGAIIFGLQSSGANVITPALSAAPQGAQSSLASGPVTSRILFLGDVFWGRSVQKTAERTALKFSQPMSGIQASDRKQYDAWIANFECPITTKDVPYSLQVSALKFNCRPEYLPEFAKWFTAASQSNNHTMNNGGQWGLEQGREHLQKAGIQPFGNYDMAKLDDICEVITVPAKLLDATEVQIPVALCGYHYVVNIRPTDEQLAVMGGYAAVMPVIAMPHMGVEYRATAEPEKVDAYRRMIDAGADMVVGAHPHVIQNSESYKGRLIAYSLGNFLFDQQSLGEASTMGLGVGLTFSIADQVAARLYQEIGPRCATFRDSCLLELTTKLPERPEIKVSYGFACYDQSRAVGSVPRLASEQLCNKAKKTATVDELTDLAHQW